MTYDEVKAKNKASQPIKCTGCSKEDSNGSIPGLPMCRVCGVCLLYGKEEVQHYL